MLKSFIGADMRLYERFGVGLHNNPYPPLHDMTHGLRDDHVSPWTTEFEQKCTDFKTISWDNMGHQWTCTCSLTVKNRTSMDVSDDGKLEDIDAKIGEKASKSLLPGETSKRKTGSKYLLIHENIMT